MSENCQFGILPYLMADVSALVTTRQYRTEVTKWLESLKRRENASVVFFPKTDRLIRFEQFLQDTAFMKSVLGGDARFFFQIMDFATHNVEDKNDMFVRMAEQMNFARLTPQKMNFTEWVSYLRKQKVTLVIVLPEAEKYLTNAGSNILSYLSHIVDQFAPLIISLCFFEADITHSDYTKLLPVSTRLYQNVHYYPLYGEDDTRTFIHYLAKKWGAKISPALEQDILHGCGGHFWLVKESVRQISEGKRDPFVEEGMQFRLRTIYDFFSPTEQEALSKIVTHKKNISPPEHESLRYFQKMNFMDARGRCRVGLYEDFIENRLDRRIEFTLQQNKIFLNDVPIDRLFSRQEHRVFRLFIEKQGSVISREEIASMIWQVHTEDNYSDWAIDQVVARLRKRLKDLSLSPELIRVARGKGYLLNLQKA